MAKYDINLLQAELFPKPPLLSLNRALGVFGFVLVIMLLWAFMSQYQLKQLSERHDKLRQEKSQQQSLLSTLEKKLKDRKPDPLLLEKLDSLKLVMVNRQALHRQLTDSSRTYVSGFAKAMTELSTFHHKDISLISVDITLDDMTFTGVAKSANTVPQWLAGFEHSVLLSGKSFINFKLQENADKLTEFVVSSKLDEEGH